MRGAWNYGDFLEQLRTIEKGPLSEVVRKIPFLRQFAKEARDDQLTWFRRMLEAMGPTELRIPELMEGPRGLERRKRVAAAAGMDEKDVARFTKTFVTMQDMVSRLTKGRRRKK